jgi:hypothetical protein
MQICSNAIDILGNTLSITILLLIMHDFVHEKHEVKVENCLSWNKLHRSTQNAHTSNLSQLLQLPCGVGVLTGISCNDFLYNSWWPSFQYFLVIHKLSTFNLL